MTDDRFSFRWGMPWLDREFMQIPTLFFGGYIRAGITRSEFLFVLHLASYKYESRRGQSRPSLARIAEEMGTSVRTVQRLKVSLEEKGLLEVIYRTGMPSMYSFHALANAMLMGNITRDTCVTPDTHVTGTPDTSVTPPLTPVSPEEQEDKKKKQQQGQPGAFVLSQEQESAMVALRAVGVNAAVAEVLAEEYKLGRVLEVVGAVGNGGDIRNPGAWVVRALQRGYTMGVTEAGTDYQRRLESSAESCMYHRNPQLGACVAEDPERMAWMMCRACVRGGEEKALEGEQQEISF